MKPLILSKQMIELFVLEWNTWNHLSLRKKWDKARLKILSMKYVDKSYMDKDDLALNNLQWLIHHKT